MRYLFILWICLWANFVNGQTPFLTIHQNKLWGAIDTSGNLMLNPAYQALDEYLYEGQFIAKMQDKWGVADLKNTSIVPFQYDAIQFDYATDQHWITILRSKKEEKRGVWSRAGKEILPTIYTRLYPQKNYWFMQKEDDWGIADSAGKVVLPCQYTEIIHADPDFFIAKQHKKWGLFKNEKELLEMAYDSIVFLNPEMCLLGKRKNDKMFFGLYHLTAQKSILPTQFDAITFLQPPKNQNTPTFLITTLDEQQQIWDLAGKPRSQITQFLYVIYDEVGVFRTFSDSLCGLASLEANLEPTFEDISPFIDKVAFIRNKDKIGLINRFGEILIAPSTKPFILRGNIIRASVGNGQTEVIELDNAGRLISRGLDARRTIKVSKKQLLEIKSTDYKFPPKLPKINSKRLGEKVDSLSVPITDTLFRIQDITWQYNSRTANWQSTKNDKRYFSESLTDMRKYPKAGLLAGNYKLGKIVKINNYISYGEGANMVALFDLQTGTHFLDVCVGISSMQRFTGAVANDLEEDVIKPLERNEFVKTYFKNGYLNKENTFINTIKNPKIGSPKDSTSVEFQEIKPFTSAGISVFKIAQNKIRYYFREGAMNRAGKMVLPPQYERIEPKGSFLHLRRYELQGLADSVGKVIFLPKYEKMTLMGKGKSEIIILQNKRVKYNFIDKYGEHLLTSWRDSVRNFSEGLALVRDSLGWYYVNRGGLCVGCTGERENRIRYTVAYDFSSERAWVKKKDKKGWILLKKNLRYWHKKNVDSVQSFVGKYAIVSMRGKWGLMNRNGSWRLKPNFFDIQHVGTSGFIAYREKKGKYALMNKYGKQLTNPIFDTFEAHGLSYITGYEGEKATIFTINGTIIKQLPKSKPTEPPKTLPTETSLEHLPYDLVGKPVEGIRIIAIQKCHKIANRKGEILAKEITENYDQIQAVGNSIFRLTKDGARGYWHPVKGWLWKPTK